MPLLSDIEAAIDRMGDRALYVEIARIFADALPETETAIAESIAGSAWEDSRRLVHSLKSNCAAMGAEELRLRICALEKACAEGDKDMAHSLFIALRNELRSLRAELLSL